MDFNNHGRKTVCGMNDKSNIPIECLMTYIYIYIYIYDDHPLRA